MGEWSSSEGLRAGAWERKQRSIAAQSMLRGTWERRQYRMEVAALGEFEERFLSSMARLMTESEQCVRLTL